MKAIIQRVMKASVTVDNEVVGSIGRGLCVLVGISRHDTEKEMEYIVRKILNIRVFSDDTDKRWMKSVMDMGYEILCISQFTLETTLKGNKPDFHCAMGPELSQPFYYQFLDALKSQYKPDKIQDGKFGAYMQVHIQNDGPVTIPLEIKPNMTLPKVINETKVFDSSINGEVPVGNINVYYGNSQNWSPLRVT